MFLLLLAAAEMLEVLAAWLGLVGAPDRVAGGTSGARARSVPRGAYPRQRPPPGGWCCFAWNSGRVKEGGQGE